MDAFTRLVNNLGILRIAALAMVGMGILAFFFYIVTKATSPSMALLYGDLESGDSSQIIAKLEGLGIPYQIGASGAQIFVPGDRVTRLRMDMAGDGLPSGGSVGFEIFDRSGGIGNSNFVQKVNRVRALEGELGRSISTITEIKAARVHLVFPQRRLFSRTSVEPTASIALMLKGGSRLSSTQVSAIQYLVAAAVPGLAPGRVSIIDNRGRLLARGGSGEAGGEIATATADEARQAYEHRVARKIEEFLERTLGPGTVRAQVTADINFDRITTTEEIFDPDSQVVRSTQTATETSNSTDGEQGGKAVSVSSSLPGPAESDGSSTSSSSATNSRTEETVNYEISKIVKQHVRASGLIRRLTVAVLVDGTYGEPAADGSRGPYQPREKEMMDRITALVRTAIGYDEKRGDAIEVVNMRFAEVEFAEGVDDSSPLIDLDKNDYFRIGEVLILLISAVLAIMFVLRPLLQRMLEFAPKPKPQAQIAAEETAALPEPSAADDTGAMIDIAQIEGKVRESSLRKVGEIVQNHPEESISILRNWMFNES